MILLPKFQILRSAISAASDALERVLKPMSHNFSTQAIAWLDFKKLYQFESIAVTAKFSTLITKKYSLKQGIRETFPILFIKSHDW